MKYHAGDKVEARNWRVKDGSWQLAMIRRYRKSDARYLVVFYGRTRSISIRTADIRPRREAEANATSREE
ncbi:MAG: hypothetical protein KAV00_02010 [Phycisphaerae bacterium]|nr:hypothetical protein [Phycisphaerae bacterium]